MEYREWSGRGIEIAVKAVRADARRAYRFEDLLLVPGHVVKTEPSTFRLNFSDGRNYRCRAIVSNIIRTCDGCACSFMRNQLGKGNGRFIEREYYDCRNNGHRR